MAEDQDLELDVSEEKEKNGSPKLIIMIVVVVVLLVGAVAAFMLMPSSEETTSESPVVENKQNAAIYLPLRPAFVVNYQIAGKQRYVQINVSLMTRDERVTEAIHQHNPLIRSNLVTLFSSQDINELKTPEGKDVLRELALEELNAILSENIGSEGLEQVLFTSFVMQ